MKKILAIILTLSIFLAAIPFAAIPASAATSGTTGDCTWSLNGTILTISGNGNMANYMYNSTLPWGTKITTVIIEDGVTSIGNYAFSYCRSLTSVTIPDSVTSIGNYAFEDCDSLTSVTIPDSVTSIGSFAFYNCSLTSVTIPDSVTSIGSFAFYNCKSLTSVTIGNSVTSIGGEAFSYCDSLTSVTIPDSVTSIGSDAFYNTAWYNNQPDGLIYAGKVAYKYKGTCPAEVIIKDGTLGIAGTAFYNCSSLTSVTIPDGVTSIGSFAFYNCSLTSVTIPDSVTSIGGSAFENCTSLTSVNIGNSVTSIEDYAFCDCTSLTSVTIPDSVTSIGITAFYDCSSLTSIEVSEKNQNYSSVDGVLFNKAKTELICYPEGKTNKDYTIPDSVTSIGWCAFSYCTSLTSVTIPDSVTSIGYRAFDDCDSLKTVYYRGSENDRKNITIDSYNEDLTNATWYYNSCIGSAEHNFDSYNICTVCGDKKYVIGDCNGDYNVDTTDLAVLKLNLAGIGELSDTGKLGADLNGDGSIDTTDLAKLKLKLAGIE